MSDFATTVNRRARKDYRCDAYLIIREADYDQRDFTREEWKQIHDAEVENGEIRKGAWYLHTVGVYEGEFYVARSRPELADICTKYNLYGY